MTQQPPASLQPALDLLRRGDRAGARRAVEAALLEQPDETGLVAFAGVLAAQDGDLEAAIPHFQRVVAAVPQDMQMRTNLAMALAETGRFEEAAQVAEDRGDPHLDRLAGWAHQQVGRLDRAALAYEAAVASQPEDFESWNNLGNVRAERGDAAGALLAYQQAVLLRPDQVDIYLNASEQLTVVGDDQARLLLMRDAVEIAPGRADILTELGLAEAAVRHYPEAEAAYRRALARDPLHLAAYLELGMLLENLNRVEDLVALVAEAEAHGVGEAELGFIRAWALRRQNRFAEARPIADAIPATIHPVRRAHLIADLADRLGETERAFAAFGEMNAASVASRPPRLGATYRQTVEQSIRQLSPAWVASWQDVRMEDTPPDPVFLVGFPRSGTTLLDTLLMNMPALHVLEEMPFLREVEHSLGGEAALAGLDSAAANQWRRRYFELVAEGAPAAGPGRRIVDKHPLRMAGMAIVSRLFPAAHVILVERHPCDVVLSCYMANFQLNDAMRSFSELDEAARTYAAVFTAWERAEAVLPLTVHRIRYERMVEDLAGEMRPLLDFLGLPWDEKVLDNQAAAAGRGHVRTASYSQVQEPIYKRAAGRWERYRAQLEPVLPILAPWCEKMGYAL
ncbi:tetratricopeptide repeat-containing sulfotransferase family protein [Allosphingosinicella sp.]|uniref:tetratricopeptide repeat-containing sulfotransferase family protein n=1 Tax=Allosphingosinicella sp. TaxID=2823234 RepID=UPI003783D14A